MRKLTTCAVALGLLTLACGPRLGAGEKKGPPGPPPPGPEHKRLSEMAGTFDAKVTIFLGADKSAVMTSKGTMTRQMVLGGRFLNESYDGSFGDQPFKGFGLAGYDTNKKKYVSVWVDSMSNTMMTSEGTYDAATKSFQHTGEEFDPASGKQLKSRDVLKVVSPDEQMLTMYRTPPGAAEFKMMEIRYTRKKNKAG